MERQNNRQLMGRQKEGREAQRAMTRRAQQWQSVLGALAQQYPELDLAAALQKPLVKRLLQAGLDLQTAVEAGNLEEIKTMIAAQAEQTVLEQMAHNASRAKENGIAAAKAQGFTVGARQMSKQDRDEIVKRVLRGEEIKL